MTLNTSIKAIIIGTGLTMLPLVFLVIMNSFNYGVDFTLRATVNAILSSIVIQICLIVLWVFLVFRTWSIFEMERVEQEKTEWCKTTYCPDCPDSDTCSESNK